MIQLTWFELLLLLFSVAISGCLIYGLFLTPKNNPEKNPPADDQDFIDAAATKRLQAYDEQEKQIHSGMGAHSESNPVVQKLEKLESQMDQLLQSLRQQPVSIQEQAASTDEHLRILEDQDDDAFINAKEAFELTIYKVERQLEKLEEACKETENENAQTLLKEIQARKITIRRLNAAFRQNCFSLQDLIETKEELQSDLDQLISGASFLKRA